MKMKGIDVSVYQGDIDFEQVKNSGVEFVIIRAGVTTRTDDKFEDNYRKAKEAGLHIGFYWYCYGETLEQISAEADACLNALEGKQFDFPIYIDLEESSQFNLGKEFCSNAIRTFCDKLEDNGYFAGFYTSTSFLNSVIDDDVKKKYVVWVADWRGYCGYDGDYGVWQYGAGYVPGINGKTDLNIFDLGYDTDYPGSVLPDGVDLDYAYEDYSLDIVFGGFNNYPKIEPEEPDDTCNHISNNITIEGITPAKIQDNWFLVDESEKFTLETLHDLVLKVYLVGGGEDGAEWFYVDSGNNWGKYDTKPKSRGGCICIKEIPISGKVSCQTIIAERNNLNGTSLKIGNDIYKCNDEGYVQRKATANGVAGKTGEETHNGENGANGVLTPYGYVGSSGGGGAAYSYYNSQYITVYAGKGGSGAGDGGEVKQSGADAVNYGCGGGSAGFFGFSALGEEVVETHAGKGMKGCVIFEIVQSENCGDDLSSFNNSCYNPCCVTHKFTCPDNSEGSTNYEKEIFTTLKYENGDPVITETTTETPISENDTSIDDSGGTSDTSTIVSSNNCSQISNCGSSNENCYSSNQSCGCGSSSSGSGKCVNLDVAKWGENWLLFDKTGEYSLTMDEDITLKLYLVGGGEDGKDGMTYNKTAYGGDGGRGGAIKIYSDIEVPKGEVDISVVIGGRGNYAGTSVIINDYEYRCYEDNSVINLGGFGGICGRHGYRQAGNGANGIETPFGYIGSSGGGGAAYYNTESTSRGRGGLYAGDGGKIVNGKSTSGDKAAGYGGGGGGGSASYTSWCKGGRGKQGCVIMTW